MTKLTPQKAASEQRSTIKGKVLREARKHRALGDPRIYKILKDLADWISLSDERFNARKGGLQGRKKKL